MTTNGRKSHASGMPPTIAKDDDWPMSTFPDGPHNWPVGKTRFALSLGVSLALHAGVLAFADRLLATPHALDASIPAEERLTATLKLTDMPQLSGANVTYIAPQTFDGNREAEVTQVGNEPPSPGTRVQPARFRDDPDFSVLESLDLSQDLTLVISIEVRPPGIPGEIRIRSPGRTLPESVSTTIGRALRNATYLPAYQDGKPVAGTVNIAIQITDDRNELLGAYPPVMGR